jgi:hypothetical protein
MEHVHDGPDCSWTVASLDGTPVLVVQANGPALSASLLQRECKSISIRYVFDTNLVPTSFVCYEGKDVLHPILSCSPDPLLEAIEAAACKNRMWILSFQVMVDGQRVAKLHLIQGSTVLDVIMHSHWMVELR